MLMSLNFSDMLAVGIFMIFRVLSNREVELEAPSDLHMAPPCILNFCKGRFGGV
jgi:hypothetical protein